MHVAAAVINEIICLIRALARAAGGPAVAVWASLDLTMAQVKLLHVLGARGQATVSELAAVLRVGVPTASHLVERLVQAGLAVRSEDPPIGGGRSFDSRRREPSSMPG